MKQNIRIAKQLVKLAKELIAYRTDEGWEKSANIIANKIEQKLLKELGWKKTGVKIGKDGKQKCADVKVQKDKDDAADWEEVAEGVSLDFGRYGGHYLCVFNCEKEGIIKIIDTSGERSSLSRPYDCDDDRLDKEGF